MASLSNGSRGNGTLRDISGRNSNYSSGANSNLGTERNQHNKTQSQSQNQSQNSSRANINNMTHNSRSQAIAGTEQSPLNLYSTKTHQAVIHRIKEWLPHTNPPPHPKSTFVARQHILSYIQHLHTENTTLYTCLNPPPITNQLSALQSQCLHLREQLARLEKMEDALIGSLGTLDNEEKFMDEQLNRNLGEVQGLQAEIRTLREADGAEDGSVGSKMSSLMDKFIDYFEEVCDEKAEIQAGHMDSNISKNGHSGNFPKLQSLIQRRKQLVSKLPNLQPKKSQIHSQPSALQLEYTQNIKQIEQTQVQTHTNLASANVLPYDNENDMVTGAVSRKGNRMMKIKRLNTITFTGFEDGDGGGG